MDKVMKEAKPSSNTAGHVDIPSTVQMGSRGH